MGVVECRHTKEDEEVKQEKEIILNRPIGRQGIMWSSCAELGNANRR